MLFIILPGKFTGIRANLGPPDEPFTAPEVSLSVSLFVLAVDAGASCLLDWYESDLGGTPAGLPSIWLG